MKRTYSWIVLDRDLYGLDSAGIRTMISEEKKEAMRLLRLDHPTANVREVDLDDLGGGPRGYFMALVK